MSAIPTVLRSWRSKGGYYWYRDSESSESRGGVGKIDAARFLFRDKGKKGVEEPLNQR